MPRKRRTNGEGTLYQRADGLWIGEITLGWEDNGKRKYKRFTSMEKDVVKRKMDEEKVAVNKGLAVDPSTITLAQWLYKWLLLYKKKVVKENTFGTYQWYIDTKILPYFGDIIPLQKITRDMVQDFYSTLDETPVVLEKTHIVLSQALKKAVANQVIYENPCDSCELPNYESEEKRILTTAEQGALVKQCASSDQYGDLYVFALYTGMRMGEIIALTWDDVDYERNIIDVNKTFAFNIFVRDGKRHKEKVIHSPKTPSSIREVPISKTALQSLHHQEGRHPILVFPSKTGVYIDPTNLNKRLKELCAAAGIHDPEEVTFHSLRHTCATRMLEKGVNPADAAKILGHKSTKMFLDRYVHSLSDNRQASIFLLD